LANSFFTELKKRNVFKVAIAYLVLSWVVIQVTQAAVPALNMPEWVNTVVFFFGIIGFPFALIFAWAFEITPEGIKKESEIAPEESITAHTGRKLDFIIIALMTLALGYFIYESRFQSNSTEPVTIAVKDSNPSDSKTESAKEPLLESSASSIAVLPFVNMSSDPEQEYFSDGITEEILNVLAKIPNLQVTSRSSAFAFKGKEINISEVAEVLDVKNILEGSVRKSGTKIRITAQLINAESDKHLWSETYDRELDDIFKVQDEISAAIVHSLKEKLGINLAVVSKSEPVISTEAHDLYLKGLMGLRIGTFKSLIAAKSSFQQTIKLEPSFSPAKIGLAEVIFSQYFIGSVGDINTLESAVQLLHQVLKVQPQSAEAYYLLSFLEFQLNRTDTAEDYFKRAYEIDPNNSAAFSTYANFAIFRRLSDFFDENTLQQLYQKVLKRDPLNFEVHYNWGIIQVFRYQNYDLAEKAYLRAIELEPANGNPPFFLAGVYASQGDLVNAIKYQKITALVDTTDPDAPIFLSILYLSLGDINTAEDYAQQAIKLSPLSGHAAVVKVQTLIFQHQDQAAMDLIKQTLDSKDTFYRRGSKGTLVNMMVYLLMKNNPEQAKVFLLNHDASLNDLENKPIPTSLKRLNRYLPTYISVLKTLGETTKANKLAKRLEFFNEAYAKKNIKKLAGRDYLNLAISALAKGDLQQISYLEQAFDNGSFANWHFDYQYQPAFYHLRDNPRYLTLIARIKAKAQQQLTELNRVKK
jgi:TolB-like protein/Tfp pilus assembly protein PilF